MSPDIDMQVWRGRVDSDDGALALRWHQCVAPYDPAVAAPGASVLIGFASDAGVVRNHGRAGAAAGPAATRAALAKLAWHASTPVFDAGDVVCTGDALEAAQSELGKRVAGVLAAGQRPLVLGGGHEVAWGTWQGLAAGRAGQAAPCLGIVNFDAHFDLRAGARGSSGTPFRQIADDCAARGWPFRYACLGVARSANTAALYARARALGVLWLEDDELVAWRLDAARTALAGFLDAVDAIHLSIDLDVLPGAVAPGVSAPAARGVDLAIVEALIGQIDASGKLLVAEIAEHNPAFDLDARTARVAARLISRLAR